MNIECTRNAHDCIWNAHEKHRKCTGKAHERHTKGSLNAHEQQMKDT
jgi:hypothetical protein